MKEIERARQDADLAQERLDDAVQRIRARLQPDIIADKVADATKGWARRSKDDAVNAARNRPGLLAAIGVGVTLWLFRKPLARKIRGLSKKEQDHGRD